MNEFKTLRVADVRGLIRLLNELHDLAAEPVLCKEHMLHGVCRLTGAAVGISALLRDVTANAQWRVVSMVDIGWAGARQRAVAHAYALGDPRRDPMEAMLPPRSGPRLLTKTRRQVLDSRPWYACPNVSEVRRQAGIDDCIYSLYFLPQPGWAMGISLHRPWGERRRFSSREALLVHLLHSELSALYQRETALSQTFARYDACLPPRQRQTLDLLLAGSSEKQAADALGLSRHTIHVYVRSLYRHFSVNTRAELLCRFLPASPNCLPNP